MKKFIASLSALALTAAALPCASAFAADDAQSTDHLSKIITIGDINNSGKIDIGDLVTAARFILGEDVDDFSSMVFDVNADGENDVFDLIELRKLVLDPDKSKIQTYAMDVLKSLKNINPSIAKIESFEDAEAYFNEMLSNDEEIKKFTELYDEEFFKDNDLILQPFFQNNSEELLYSFADDAYNSISKILKIDLSNTEDTAKAVKDEIGTVLTQISLPKEMSDLIEEIDLVPLTADSLPDEEDIMKLLSFDIDKDFDVQELYGYLGTIFGNEGSSDDMDELLGFLNNGDALIDDALNNSFDWFNNYLDIINSDDEDVRPGTNLTFEDFSDWKELLDIE